MRKKNALRKKQNCAQEFFVFRSREKKKNTASVGFKKKINEAIRWDFTRWRVKILCELNFILNDILGYRRKKFNLCKTIL